MIDLDGNQIKLDIMSFMIRDGLASDAPLPILVVCAIYFYLLNGDFPLYTPPPPTPTCTATAVTGYTLEFFPLVSFPFIPSVCLIWLLAAAAAAKRTTINHHTLISRVSNCFLFVFREIRSSKRWGDLCPGPLSSTDDVNWFLTRPFIVRWLFYTSRRVKVVSRMVKRRNVHKWLFENSYALV